LTVTSLDGTAVQTIVVTITGTNDAPTLAAGVLDAVEDGAVVTLDLADLGNDIDNLEDGSTLTYTISGAPAVGTAQITGTTLSYDIGVGFQHLAEGETDTVTITVTATDAFGASVSNDVTVTITGTNDAPVITSGLQDTPTSGVNGDGQLELTGSIGFTDLDLTDTHIISATSASGTAVSVTLAMAATNGALGVVNWAYTAGAQSPLGGQDTITFIISDTKLGGTAQGSLTIDLPSGNGAPDVSFPMQIFSLAGEGALPEDVNAYFLDPESDPLTAQADPAQIYSGMTFNGTSEIVFNPDDDAFQFLTFGEQYVGTYTFLLSDGTTTQTAEIEWTIEGYRTKVAGSQDADALFGDDFTPTLIEGGAGDDTMTGGFVENIFAYFAAGDGFDLITNFVVGQDKIGVSAAAFGGNLVGGADATVLVASDFAQVDAGG
ncbi:MAG: VCBS domain-containing protein, partial [Cypionkella sp.]